METETTAGERLETADSVGQAFTGDEALSGRKDAVWHVARFIESQDFDAFDDSYAQLTDPADNDPAYVANFKRTVSQLTDLIAFGKIIHE